MAEPFAAWWGTHAHDVLSRLGALDAGIASAVAEFNGVHNEAIIQAQRVSVSSAQSNMRGLRADCKLMLRHMASTEASVVRMNARVDSTRADIDALRREVRELQGKAFEHVRVTAEARAVPLGAFRAPPANIRADGRYN